MTSSETPQTTPPSRRRGEAAAFVVTIVILVALALLGVALWRTIGKDLEAPGPIVPANAEKPRTENPVMVTVNGEQIRRSEFEAAAARLPREMQGVMSSPEGMRALADELIRMKALEQYARGKGFEREPDVAAAIEVARGEILANAALRDMMATQKDVSPRELYDQNKRQWETVRLSQIVIPYQGSVAAQSAQNAPKRDEAMRLAGDVVARLRGGASFEELAKKISADRQSAERGGDIGLVSHGTLPEKADEAIFSLPVGSITDPIATSYGVHVFKITGKQTRSFEEVKDALARSGKQLQAQNAADALREGAEVEYNPKYFPNEAKAASEAKAAKAAAAKQ